MKECMIILKDTPCRYIYIYIYIYMQDSSIPIIFCESARAWYRNLKSHFILNLFLLKKPIAHINTSTFKKKVQLNYSSLFMKERDSSKAYLKKFNEWMLNIILNTGDLFIFGNDFMHLLTKLLFNVK